MEQRKTAQKATAAACRPNHPPTRPPAHNHHATTRLAGQQYVLPRLRHGAVDGGDDQDGAVHLLVLGFFGV